ncbi:hypothetical protein PR202_ga24571 [Eleusine coracana subsp. coracana]|uniref:Uncharacterized protein n=1 Tax=Eleusine coracana subsp. coracana TaxID=191504 RepID=A0AAV5D8V4_ELECO|nr:hypothetical protein PR202_ga24571 [Eleusine coracana subsp. coracana]
MTYICTFSGEDEASSSLEQSTLVDEHVVLTTLLSIMSSVSAMIIRSPLFKYFCLFKLSGGRSNRQMLHLLASQARECGCSTVFSYLFILKYLKPDPQKSVPSISVIGLNGVMLWHHEGHIIAENLKESIEKAWAALHLQCVNQRLSLHEEDIGLSGAIEGEVVQQVKLRRRGSVVV